MGCRDDIDCDEICISFMKLTLFVLNFLITVKGGVILVIGIYAQVEAGALMDIRAGDILASPGIILIIIGLLLFLIGLFGCIGVVKELIVLLIIYIIVLIILVILEILLAGYLVVQQDEAHQRFRNRIEDYIVRYYDNADLQNIIDFTQSNFECCGASGPDDWQANIYFNCTSIALQRCSVPFSCCIPPEDENEIINLQCGYRTLDKNNSVRFFKGIYSDGCVSALEGFLGQYFIRIAGIGGVVIFLKILTIFVVIILILDILFDKEKEERNPSGDEPVPSKESTLDKDSLPGKEESVEEKEKNKNEEEGQNPPREESSKESTLDKERLPSEEELVEEKQLPEV